MFFQGQDKTESCPMQVFAVHQELMRMQQKIQDKHTHWRKNFQVTS